MLCIGTSILYDDPLGDTLNISVTASTTLNGSDLNIYSQGTTNSGSRGGGLTLKTGSSSSDKSGILSLKLGNYASDASISIAEATLGARVIGLCLSQSSMDSTLMPAGTGDNVIYIGDATAVPTTGSPVDGLIMYVTSGELFIKQSDGTEYKAGKAPSAKVVASTDVVYFPLDDGYGTTTITNVGSRNSIYIKFI